MSFTRSVAVPDLASFSLHKIVYDVDFDGVPVPGLVAAFYRRPDGDRVLSVGVYMADGVELFRAWGHTDEAHCAHHAITCPDGTLDGPHIGCPEVTASMEDGRAIGVAITTRDNEYFVAAPGTKGIICALSHSDTDLQTPVPGIAE
ncbi:MAG TPA: hypothetical protein H9881_03090 [Candidatus Stackebrandtia excrementipullorum]|nr:hypothetical protein [Candidatus Stackebrandtia excrementipullorum]